MLRFRIKQHVLVMACLLGAGISMPANSTLNTELANFYNSLSGRAAATPPAVYQGQSAYYATFGALNARSPVRNYQIISLSMPTTRAGCGGIDIYGGGFSFINKDEFVAMLKNIGSNAIGFAFQLALDVISPQISDNIKQLMSKIENIANMNINSCEAAQKLVGGAMKALDLQSSYCRQAARVAGTVPDGSAARKLCSDSADYQSVLDAEKNKNDKASQDQRKSFSGNLIWEGLKRRGMDPVNNANDKALMELIMSITGTIIIPAGREINANGNPIEFTYAVGEVRYQDLANTQNLANPVAQILRCVDPSECLSVTTVAPVNPDVLYGTISAIVDNIVNHIATGNPAIGAQELRLIGMTKLPIYALMQAAADVSPDTLAAVADSVKNLAVAETTHALISDTVMIAIEALGATPASGILEASKIDAFRERAKMVRLEAFEAAAEERRKFGGVFEVMRQTNYWRTEAMNKFAPNLGQRLALARAMSIQR